MWKTAGERLTTGSGGSLSAILLCRATHREEKESRVWQISRKEIYHQDFFVFCFFFHVRAAQTYKSNPAHGDRNPVRVEKHCFSYANHVLES
jgi:hypothetical protein